MNRSWRLPQLLGASGIQFKGAVPDLPIHQVTDDSRTVGEGALFVAVRGTQVDGHRFLRQAIDRGARVVLIEQDQELPPTVVKLQVGSTKVSLGPLIHAFVGAPSKRLKMIGITGTNGKTTVAWLVQYLLETAHIPCGLIGTVCTRIGTTELPSKNTTPGVSALQATLLQMVQGGCQACSMEVSSHALDQHRTDGIQWVCGLFTNLTPEHLDYHGTVERYLQAKLRLFQDLGPEATAVIHRDDPAWERVAQAVRGRVVTYGVDAHADLMARKILCSLEETLFELETSEGRFPVTSPLIGRHNVENLLAALGAVTSVGVPIQEAILGVAGFPGVPGRLERIEAGQPFLVFVDYAHTDGALRSVLSALRAFTTRRILVVFGCGGDRDRTKRPRMGRVAAELSDRVIITSDNPRSEDPEGIAEEVASGLRGSSTPWRIVLDRREAIETALKSVDEGWLVLIAGKGHESGQILRDRVVPFDDRLVTREILGMGYVSVA